MNGNRIKLASARWLYRWQLAVGIVGAAFTLLTFVGVFTILLGPWLSQFGLTQSSTLLLLLVGVLVFLFGFGLFLDRVAKFWAAQAAVGTVRNPWLYDRLYEKEYLTLVNQHLPVVRALRAAVYAVAPNAQAVLEELDQSIDRLEETIQNKRWTVHPNEKVYDEDSI